MGDGHGYKNMLYGAYDNNPRPKAKGKYVSPPLLSWTPEYFTHIPITTPIASALKSYYA